MKVETITITLRTEAGVEIICARDKNYLWNISAPVYSRIIKLLGEIQFLCKQNDIGANANAKDRNP